MLNPTESPPEYNNNFDGLLSFLRDPEIGPAALSPKRFSEALDMDIRTLAELAKVHRNTISRSPKSDKLQHFQREALRVIRAATDVSDDLGKALFWYRNEPLPPFGYKCAEQLVSDGRAEDLLRYIASFEAGAAG